MIFLQTMRVELAIRIDVVSIYPFIHLSIYLRTLSYDNFITDSAGTAWKVCHHRFICHGQSDITSIFMASQQMSFVDHMVNLMWFIWFILFKTSYTSDKVNPVCHFQLQASTAGLAIWG